jgi:pyruvate kinase
LQRRTRIVATLGPATDAPGVLEALFEVGLDVVRINYSHGSATEHAVEGGERFPTIRVVRVGEGGRSCEP